MYPVRASFRLIVQKGASQLNAPPSVVGHYAVEAPGKNVDHRS
jgi:hypothetical protein